MKSLKNLCAIYARWIITSWILVLFVRVVETLLLNRHHFIFHLIYNEAIGIGIDLMLLSTFFVFLFPVFYLFSRFSLRIAHIFTGIFLGGLVVSHIAIIQFFIQTSKPLGGMLVAHTLNEVVFTIRSAGTHYFLFGAIIISAIGMEIIAWILLKKYRFHVAVYHAICIFSVLSIIFSVLINNHLNKVEQETPPYSVRINKSYYFYRNMVYILQKPYTGTTESMRLSERNKLFPNKHFVSDEYPLLSETNNVQDVLGDFFKCTPHSQLPNIVIIIVEGLGSRFLPDFHGLKLMPFLDSLSKKSLYWEKALTVGERSFSVVPSILASAPYANRGFIFENDILSLSLLNILSKYNYYSTFFYGQPKWFHNKETYFHKNGLNKLIDNQQFPKKYFKIMVGDYFWGHHDQDLVRYALEIINDSLPEAPRLDIYFTGTMHPPFIIEQEEFYNQRLSSLICQAGLEKQERKFVETYWKYMRTLLFTDDALRILFSGYQQHPSYQNTIFIITGDHPMSEIPIENSFQRYRVPIIIYSPFLKRTKTFYSVNSHLDVTPTLLAFLHQNYHIQLPKQNAFIGKTLDTAPCFRNLQPIVFMNSDRYIVDILYENYFLLNEKTLFRVYENDMVERIENKVLKENIFAMLQNFKRLNTYTCSNNRLIPDTLYYESVRKLKP